jgi:hypothetical protein
MVLCQTGMTVAEAAPVIGESDLTSHSELVFPEHHIRVAELASTRLNVHRSDLSKPVVARQFESRFATACVRPRLSQEKAP